MSQYVSLATCSRTAFHADYPGFAPRCAKMDTVSIRRCTVVVSTDSSRTMPDWVKYGVFWHVYPLGFCGADIRPAGPRRFHGRGLDAIIPWLEYVRVRPAAGSGVRVGDAWIRHARPYAYRCAIGRGCRVRSACRGLPGHGIAGDAGWRVQSREPQSSGRSGGA